MKVITLTGTTYLNRASCLCGVSIGATGIVDDILCLECGAYYYKVDMRVADGKVEVDYEFNKYACVSSRYARCLNECLGPGMHCKEHLTQKSFQDAQDALVYAEQTVEGVNKRIETMNESLRQWKIIELSGIDDK